SFRPRFSLTDKDYLGYLKITLPLMLGVTLLTVDEWIGRMIASLSVSGAISWLNNARRLMLVPMALIGQAAAQAALPFLSQLVAEKREDEMGETLTSTIQGTLFLSVLSAVVVAIVSPSAVSFVYERHAYSRADAARTAQLLLCFAPAIPVWAVQVVSVRGFYARGDTLRPMVVGTIVTLLSLPVYIFLYENFALPGLALSTSVGLALNAVATIVVYQVAYGGLRLRALGVGFLRTIVVSVCAGGPVWLLAHYWPFPKVGFPHAALFLAVNGLLFLSLAGIAASRLDGPEGQLAKRIGTKLLRPLRRLRPSA
ncbi:MAG: oligosaccharide flippase family protein, partial [Myxococcales bacterium]|nr:oligosaccharide flippase family protein [Myxococcales bacterium]